MGTTRFVLSALLSLALSSALSSAHTGQLRVFYEQPSNVDEQDIVAFIRDSGIVEDTLDVVRDEFNFPENIRLVFGGDDGPLYDPDIVQITIPYFFIDRVDERIASLPLDLSVEDRDTIVLAVLEHTLYHELGHAIVHLLDLHFSGREEDAVDTLATIIMVESFKDGDLAALDAMEDFYALDAEEGGAASPGFFAEHSLDIERYRSGVCLVYGSDPKRHKELREELEPSEAQTCKTKWSQARARWEQRLQPILKAP